MRAISAVPLLTLAALVMSVSTLVAQSSRDPRDRRTAEPQAVPRGDRDPYGRDRYDDRYRRPGSRMDLAFGTGQSDGYDAGYEDGRKRHRFEPTREGRYRSANRGYDRRYGSKELWQTRYRDGFRRGYEDGYNDARRYTYRTGDRGRGWWPF
jgi:hypothetical protein